VYTCMRQKPRCGQVRRRHSSAGGGCGCHPCRRHPPAADDDKRDWVFQRPQSGTSSATEGAQTERFYCDTKGHERFTLSHSLHMFIQARLAPRPEACKVEVGHSCQTMRISLAARTPVLYCPPQHLQFPVISGVCCSRAHCNISKCPTSAAYRHVASSHSQPCSRAHFSTVPALSGE